MGSIAKSWTRNLKESRPKLYRSLKKSGHLEAKAEAAEQRYLDSVASLMESGMTPGEAQQVAREMYLSTQGEGRDILASNLSSM